MIGSNAKEVKRCWKCDLPLTINEYGYAVCRTTDKHEDGSDAYIFGDKDITRYKQATLSPTLGDYKQTDGYKVRQLRAKLGETQVQFAEHFNVNNVSVSLWETNKVKPPQEVLAWQLTQNNESQAT